MDEKKAEAIKKQFNESNITDYQKMLYCELIDWAVIPENKVSDELINNYAASAIERRNSKMLPLEKKYFKQASNYFIDNLLPELPKELKASLINDALPIFEQTYGFDVSCLQGFYTIATDNLKAIASRGIIKHDYTFNNSNGFKSEPLEYVFKPHTVENTYSRILNGWATFQDRVNKKKEKAKMQDKEQKVNPKVKKGYYDLDKIKQGIRIEDYARELGFHVVRVGAYLTLSEHDSVRIDPVLNRFWRNSNGASGTVIDFGIEFEGKDKDQIIKELWHKVDADFKPSDTVKERSKEKFHLILNAPNMNKALSYLKSRCIADEVIKDIVDRKMIYESYKNECVFIGYNENRLASWGCVRGTGEQRFYAEMKGSDQKVGYYVNNHAPVTVITEGCIDLLSYMTLRLKEGKDLKNANYLALGSCNKINTAVYNFETYHPDKMIIALDNDKAGQTASLKLEQKLKDVGCNHIEFAFSNQKDWNDDLCKLAEKPMIKQTLRLMK